KIDLDPSTSGAAQDQFRISAARGDGIAELVGATIAFARDYFGAGESGLIGRQRQRKLLEETVGSLRRSLEVTGGEELVAEELRRGAGSLGRLLGRVDVEDILDVIFREFCIGK